jgi:hypothetical protein
MSKDIWHKPSEITDTDNNLIIKDFVNRTYEIGWFDDNDMIFRNFRNSDTYDEEGMMKWCDVDDIVNDYERLQNELDRTKKQLEIAVDTLNYIRRTNPISFHFEAIEKALDQITATLENQNGNC